MTAAALGAPAMAQAAPPPPFGHACVPQSGVLFCPTAADAQRVPSFDGVPLDVDVTLPTTGDGPFPTIAILHGFGADKTSYEAVSSVGLQASGTVKTTAYHNNNVFYAQRGYAVVNYSARGFGRSCGKADSRTAPGCDRGWLHLADQRYEGRDTQYLLGLLVDQGVARADALGVTGESYGGGQTQMLARLRNRVRMPDGTYVPWTSPNGAALEFKAAWSRWGWADLVQSLTPNGHRSHAPAGVKKQSYVEGLYLLSQVTGFLAPVGADSTADLTAWKATIDKGEPYGAADRTVDRQLTGFHSMIGVSGTSAPLLAMNGWRDELFPATEALRAYSLLRGQQGGRVALQLGDVGHSAGSNKVGTDHVFNDQAARWFDALLKGSGKPLPNGLVTVLTSSCPAKTAPARGPYRASSLSRLQRGRFVARGGGRGQRVTSTGGNPDTAKAFDQRTDGDACKTVPRERAPGTAIVQRRVRRAFTLLGMPTVRATIKTRGKNGLLAARLWDVFAGKQRLVSRGVYRLRNGQRGRIAFQLFGNAYDVRRGHRVKLELVGRDPDYLRTSNSRFSVGVKRLSVSLPTRQRRPR